MSRVFYAGVDPGANGGLVALDNDNKIFALQRMPDTLQEVLAWFRMFEHLEAYVMLEQVSGYIGVEHPGSTMFEFGKGYGHLEMALVATGFTDYESWEKQNRATRGNYYQHILPQRWQRGLGLRTKQRGETDTEWKNYLKEQAQSLMPKIKVTKATADAILIAHYCKLTREGKNGSK